MKAHDVQKAAIGLSMVHTSYWEQALNTILMTIRQINQLKVDIRYPIVEDVWESD